MNMITDLFTKLEPMQARYIVGLTLYPLKASIECKLENIRTFDELADPNLQGFLNKKGAHQSLV